MSSDHRQQALRPIETEPGVLVHPAADRRLAVEHWLLSTLPAAGRDRARTEWQHYGLALIPLGVLFSAVRIPGRLIHAAVGSDEPTAVDAFLNEALDSGPVICDPRAGRYYALVPASVPRTWHAELDDLREDDVGVLGRAAYLGVPRVDAVALDPGVSRSYWSVPMDSAGELCPSSLVGRLIGLGRELTGGELELDGPEAAARVIRDGC